MKAIWLGACMLLASSGVLAQTQVIVDSPMFEGPVEMSGETRMAGVAQVLLSCGDGGNITLKLAVRAEQVDLNAWRVVIEDTPENTATGMCALEAMQLIGGIDQVVAVADRGVTEKRLVPARDFEMDGIFFDVWITPEGPQQVISEDAWRGTTF